MIEIGVQFESPRHVLLFQIFQSLQTNTGNLSAVSEQHLPCCGHCAMWNSDTVAEQAAVRNLAVRAGGTKFFLRTVRNRVHAFCARTHTHTHTRIYIHTYIYTHIYTHIHTHIYIYTHTYIQGVSQLVDITAGGDFLGLCDQKSSYKHVSDFGRLRSYGHFSIPIHALV